MPTKTVSQSYPKSQALTLIQQLFEESRWFTVEPLPYDVYAITIKPERELPEPLGIVSGGRQVPFDEWFESVDRRYTELGPEVKEEFRDYFLRGFTPSEAVHQEHLDAEA